MTVVEPLATPQQAKLTIKDFLLLHRSGAFSAYAKTELIDGAIIVVNAQFSEHMVAKVLLLRRLADACDSLARGMEAWSEGSVALGSVDMPEPDLFITRERPSSGPIRGESVVLIAEISDTTAPYDLGKKMRLYAAARVPEYWVVDLAAKRVHQFWSPNAKGYREKRDFALGEQIDAITIPGLSVSTYGL